jgi:hypothetical protein
MVVLVIGALALAPATAGADITVGSSLAGAPTSNLCAAGLNCTYFQTSGSTPVAVSPVYGRIVRWRLRAGSTGGQVVLRVLRPTAGGLLGAGSSTPETVAVAGVNTFPADLPIAKGDVLALDNATSGIYFTNAPAVADPVVRYFQNGLVDGATGLPADAAQGLELLLNADIVEVAPAPPQPHPQGPVITSLRFSRHLFRSLTTIRYTLANPATVRFTVDRCTRTRRSRVRNVRICLRYARVPGSVTVAGRAGTNSRRFTGRIGGRRLATGLYRLVATPSDATTTGTPRRAAFEIRPPSRQRRS